MSRYIIIEVDENALEESVENMKSDIKERYIGIVRGIEP